MSVDLSVSVVLNNIPTKSYSENMPHFNFKRKLECDPFEICGGKIVKRRRCSPEMHPYATYNSNVKYQSSPNKMSLKSPPREIISDFGEKSEDHHRKLKVCSNNVENSEHSSSFLSSSTCDTAPAAPVSKNRNLFTYRHVNLICENILREKEKEIRKKYDDILTTKLEEQYDAFVNFTQAEIEKRYKNRTPTYLS